MDVCMYVYIQARVPVYQLKSVCYTGTGIGSVQYPVPYMYMYVTCMYVHTCTCKTGLNKSLNSDSDYGDGILKCEDFLFLFSFFCPFFFSTIESNDLGIL